MHNRLNILKVLGLTSTLILFTSYVERESIETYHLESGVNITKISTQDKSNALSYTEKASLDTLVAQGYSGININIGYLQDNKFSGIISTEPEINLEYVKALIDYAESKNLKVYLRALINNRDGSFRKEIAPENPDEWFSQYSQILRKISNIPVKKKYDIYLGSELDELLLSHPKKFEELIKKLRTDGFNGKIIQSIIFNYDADTSKINVLNNLPIDIIGIDFYVSMMHKETSEKKRYYEPKYYITKIFDTSKKPVMFTELGYRSIEKGNINPWNYRNNDLSTDYSVQKRCFENFFKALLCKDFKNEKNLGIYFWITDNKSYDEDILLTKDSRQSGYSFFNKPAEDVVRKFNKERLFFKYDK